jgi:D-alanyl-D-alanine dipeptidase
VTYLRKPAAMALDSVLTDLKKMGLGLKIFDAYRPYFITVQLWEKEPDPRYAADPAKGSGHNRGIAVDLSLIDLKTRQPLEMPTGFDSFSDSAHQDFMALSALVIQHRNLLKKVMEKHGFIALATEWWHFSWPHPENYEVLDLRFNQMKEIAARDRTGT